MKRILILSAFLAATIGPASAGGISSHGESSAMSAGPSASKPVASSISAASSTSHSSGSTMSQSNEPSNACPPANVKTGWGQCELPPSTFHVNGPVYLDYRVGKTFWGKRKVDGVIRSQTPIPMTSFQTNALHISCTKFACAGSADATTPMPFRAGMKARAIDFTAHCFQGPDDIVAHCKVAIAERDNAWQ